MTKVSIYEDNVRLSELVVMMLENTEGFEVTGVHQNCLNVLDDIHKEYPNVIVMDIDMPEVNGLEGVLKVKQANKDIKVLMHTVFDDDKRLFECLKRGADGYILKRDSATMLIQAIKDVENGGAPMSPAIARQVLQAFHQTETTKEYDLTEREREILQLLSYGNSYKLIAVSTKISIETVRRHLQNIYQKLHVQSATEAISKAFREKLVK
ncbi:response regulator transcription factor [Emticicia fontis]